MAGGRIRAVALAVALLAGLVTMVAGAPPAAAAPANDAFASRIVLASPSSTSGTTIGATADDEDGPSIDCDLVRAVWYSFTPPSSGSLALTLVSGTRQTVAVYIGSPPVNHARRGCASDPLDGDKHLAIDVAAHVEYKIAVAVNDIGQPGPFTLDLIFSSPVGGPPSNDAFASATTLATLPALRAGDLTHASLESGEPTTSCAGPRVAGTAWYKYIPTSSGVFTLNVLADNENGEDGTPRRDIIATMYRGSTLSSLTKVGCARAETRLSVTQNTSYWIEVSGPSSSHRGPFALRATFSPPGPPNDNFAERVMITHPSTTNGTSAGASIEENEPSARCTSGTGTVWFGFTASAPGIVELNIAARRFGYAVYKGSSLGSLTEVACGTDGDTWGATDAVPVLAGSEYAIAVQPYGDYDTAGHPLTLSTTFTPAPANDMFANRINVKLDPGQLKTRIAVTAGSTTEPAEPPSSCGPTAGTVWYRYKAPDNGSLLVDPSGAPSAVVRVYEGRRLGELSDEVCMRGNAPVTQVPVAAGSVYAIVVSSASYFQPGDVELKLTYVPLLPGLPA